MRRNKPRAHFPTHDVGPLVDENGQVAPGLHPLGVGCADDRLARGPDHQRFGEFGGRRGMQLAVGGEFEAVVRDDGALLGKSLDVGRFLFQVRQRNEQRKIRVFVSRVLEHFIQLTLDVFPQCRSPTA